MATTALFVEILVIGALAELWLAVLILPLQPGFSADKLFALFTTAKDAQAAVAIVALAVTYAVGWVMNYVAQELLKRVRKNPRVELFGSAAAYDEARLKMLQYGSSSLVNDVLIDRHIIRIARAGAVNFACLAVALLVHAMREGRGVLYLLAAASAALAFGSFRQWLSRHESHYRRIASIANLQLDTKPAAK